MNRVQRQQESEESEVREAREARRRRAREKREMARDRNAYVAMLEIVTSTAFASVREGAVTIWSEAPNKVRETIIIERTDGAVESLCNGMSDYRNGSEWRFPIPSSRVKRVIVIRRAFSSPCYRRIDRIADDVIRCPDSTMVCVILLPVAGKDCNGPLLEELEASARRFILGPILITDCDDRHARR